MAPPLIGIILLLAVVWIFRADRRILRGLRRSGAISPEKAISLQTNNPLFKWRIERLRTGGVIRDRKVNRIYLNEDAWTHFSRLRRRRFAIILGFLAGVVMAWYLIFAGS